MQLFRPVGQTQNLRLFFQAPNQVPHVHYPPEMLHILERFFDTRVAVPPYRPNALTAFLRVIQCPANVFKDLFQIVHLEMDPTQAAKHNYRWTPRLCMAVPPSAPNIIPLCQPGLVRLKDKMLIFLQLTRANVQMPPGLEPLSFCIPLVYDFGNNSTTLPQVCYHKKHFPAQISFDLSYFPCHFNHSLP